MVVLSNEIERFNPEVLENEQLITRNGEFAVMRPEEIFENYIPSKKPNRSRIEDLIVKESNFQVLKYILSHLDLRKINKVLLTDSQDLSSKNLVENVKYLASANNVRAIVDFKKVNKDRDLNKYFSGINDILPEAGLYISCVETHRQRNRRLTLEKSRFIAGFVILFEFVLYRIFPKIGVLRLLTNKISKGKLPVLSLAETLGRLVYNGFNIIEFKNIRNLTFFVVMKTKEVYTTEEGLNRYHPYDRHLEYEIKKQKGSHLGKHHAYAEYLPDFVLHLNGLNPAHPIKDDFRYNVIGRFLYGSWRQSVLNQIQWPVRVWVDMYQSIRQLELFPKIDLENIFYIKNSLGKDGKTIRIYKFRTMVRDADKLDNIIVEYNSYGNPVSDPRITRVGRIMRKIWIDELPQLYSLFKGDIRLVGIRPMRESDWDRYPEELKKKALQYKPGLMGIQYGTLVQEDFQEHIEFFHSYLDLKNNKPLITDIRFFFRILYYIFFKGVRSD